MESRPTPCYAPPRNLSGFWRNRMMYLQSIEAIRKTTDHEKNADVDSTINELLQWLGITRKYRGSYFTSYAVSLCLREPERLLLITKWVYPDVAKHFRTGWQSVERNIRTVAEIAWKNCPEKLAQIAGCELDHKPSNSEFIRILTNHIDEGQFCKLGLRLRCCCAI